ncbi:anthranilate phosphoribosyltransferase [Prolixibacter denitrificans]|uniref:Anthranilate phosphoribosyltransferase n=1 Tax=Prolixibacter denitrificans TaxID=1541063 RepID=A0A2P8CI65_9BACT|nr:anthranilate phosphoribosyltransferase [Prolixibacter denitrificans]PSK84622.1 anthranilate phosphoribosyltransferase [Prolixibacter denitrificans]GET20788.1 anthranilate phosphoribosyltransferase [Prolixibacter denitrificans]
MKEILNYLFEYKKLTSEQAEAVLLEITEGKYTDAEIAAFITVFNMRTISIEELEGFRNALLKTRIPVDFSDFETIDLCGTGGDGKDTFNISTLSAFVVAGAGEKVAKHGNYGASSSCGSSNVMEHLGYRFSNDADQLRKELDSCGITFLHAPLFNPAMKNVAPVRRALRLKTFFNMLGPMVNPSQPKNQMVGVFSLELGRMYSYLYQKSDKNFCILHSLDGYDEISLTGEFKMQTNYVDRLLSPSDIGLPKVQPEELASTGDIPGTAKIFTDVLNGKGTEAQNSAVIANSAMALHCVEPQKSIEQCIEEARSSLAGKKALKIFTQLMEIQK